MTSVNEKIEQDLDSGSQPDEAQLAEVREVVQEFSKTIKILQTYPRSNNISINAMDRLVEVFDDCLSRRGVLELFVDRHEINWQGETVYSESDPHRSFAMKLDRDGVRRIVFQQGITKEEIVGLLEALTTEIDQESLEDDLVTLLWDKQFQHIKVYVLADMSTEQYDPALVGADGDVKDAPEDGSSEGSTSKSSPKDWQGGQGDPGPQLALCAAAKAKLHPFSDERAAQLKEFARQEEEADLAGDLTEILFDILLSKTQQETYVNALKVLVELTMMNVRGNRFAMAALTLERLRALAANDEADNDLRAIIVEQLRLLGDPIRLDIIVATVRNEVEINKTELARFFKTLPATAAPGICDLLEVAGCDEVVRMAVSHLAKEDPTVLTERLAQPNVEMAKKVLSILEEIAGPSLASALTDPLTSAKIPVKEASVKLLAQLKTPPARDLLLSYVALEHPRLRKAALAALADFSGDGASPTVLRQQVMMKDFDERSLYDKKTLLMTIVKLESQRAVDFLVRVLDTAKWFEKEKHAETRACAALALGEIDSDAARAALEKHESDKVEVVRTATRLALNQTRATAAVGS